jgi:hypothetical protein
MYHETWMAYGPRYLLTHDRTGQRKSHSIFCPDDDSRDLLSKHWGGETVASKDVGRNDSSSAGAKETAVARDRLDLNAKRRRMMPVHLLPFIPYVEKSVDGPVTSHEWQREGSSRVDTIRAWLNTCARLHGTRCGNIINVDHGSWNGPIWLINVTDGCLVSAPPGAAYVALSYVWGATSGSCTTRSTLDYFRQENGLHGNKETLPRVVTDAMDLVRSLGIPFLWVDRFCIVQDDGLAKQCQLNAMGSIYANAHFTLIAAQNEDATQSLYTKYEASDITDPTRSKVTVDCTDGEVLLDNAMHLMRSKWYSRAWTFQEYLLSKRRVVFHNNTVNWECLCASWHEYQDLDSIHKAHQLQIGKPGGHNRSHTPQAGFGFESLPWPNMFRYARLVSMYNRHDLTFPEDIFNAFAGILTHLSRSFPGGFISGLPQMCFDAALLWQPWTTMTRRKPVGRSPGDAVLPSWSWAGWTGDIHSESWRSAANYLFETDDEANRGQQCLWKTISAVKWTYSVDLTSRRKEIRIPPEFSCALIKPCGDGKLPVGWSVQEPTRALENVSYHHTCDPNHPFRYPIPIRDRNKAHIPPVTARYLHGTTTRGFLTLGLKYTNPASDCPARDLLTPSGEWAGVLRLNHMDCTEKIMHEEHLGERSRIVELIAISEGEVENQSIEEKSFDEWNRMQCPRFKGLYEFVNVFWVEWEEDVAFRKALGRVEKGVWRQLAKEMVEVTLG